MSEDTVELQTFIATALVQIVRAVQQAGVELADTDAVLVPRVMGGPSTAAATGHMRSARYIPVTLVEFDVAVTATKESGKNAGIGVIAGVLSAGAGAKAHDTSSTVSRLSLSVPIELPSTDSEKHDPSGAP